MSPREALADCEDRYTLLWQTAEPGGWTIARLSGTAMDWIIAREVARELEAIDRDLLALIERFLPADIAGEIQDHRIRGEDDHLSFPWTDWGWRYIALRHLMLHCSHVFL